MTRHTTDSVRAKIEQFEALKLAAYLDSVGVLTIGYGHTGADVKPGMIITRERADALLSQDLARFEAAVERLVKVQLSDNQFGALVSFAFNVGEGPKGLGGSTLLKKLNAGNYDAVPGELAKWNKGTVKGRKVVLPGLTNRRAAEAGIWAAGARVASNTVIPAPAAPVPTPAKSPTNWIAAAGAGIPAATAVVKGAADTVNGTTAQINDAAGAVKQSVTVVRDATDTWAGWVNWHLPPWLLAIAGCIGLAAVAIVVWRHTKLLKDAAS